LIPFTPSSPAASSISSGISAAPLDEALLAETEASLFAELLGDCPRPAAAPVLFVLGAPRTGSTVFYQALIQYFRLPYFSNLTNTVFPRHPLVAAHLLHALRESIKIGFSSNYGKTTGALQPSEASYVFHNWFGGEQPSQSRSCSILEERREHCVRTVASIQRLFRAPLVTKNAWNCFRIESLARLFPNAFFLWIRRDLIGSAVSDLAARYVVQNDPNVWNSATPARVEELRRRPCWEQVIENQYEFSVAIEEGLARYVPDRHAVVWYEELVRRPRKVLAGLARRLQATGARPAEAPFQLPRPSGNPRPLRDGDEAKIRAYVASQPERFAGLTLLRNVAASF